MEVVERLWELFHDEFASKFPQDEGFQLSRESVYRWVLEHGYCREELEHRELRRRESWIEMAPVLEEWKKNSRHSLPAQRFELVPATFEAALCVSLLEHLKRGGRVLKCARCGLPISCDRSPRSNRQKARWQKGEQVYHSDCHQRHRLDKKREANRTWAARSESKARRREQARERRRV